MRTTDTSSRLKRRPYRCMLFRKWAPELRPASRDRQQQPLRGPPGPGGPRRAPAISPEHATRTHTCSRTTNCLSNVTSPRIDRAQAVITRPRTCNEPLARAARFRSFRRVLNGFFFNKNSERLKRIEIREDKELSCKLLNFVYGI